MLHLGLFQNKPYYKDQEHTLILNALLKPLAKKPPNGAMMDANSPSHKACHCTGKTAISLSGICETLQNEEKELINLQSHEVIINIKT
jgi:hypothetical protein